MRSMRVPLCVGVVLIQVSLIGCAVEKDRAEIKIGGLAPSFSFTTHDQVAVSSDSLEGQIVILNFWSTTCASCVKELTDLQEVAAAGKAKVIGIALDEGGWRSVRPILERHHITFPVALGDEPLFTRFEGYGIPYTLVLDRARRIAKIHRGPVTKQLLEEDIRSLGGSA